MTELKKYYLPYHEDFNDLESWMGSNVCCCDYEEAKRLCDEYSDFSGLTYTVENDWYEVDEDEIAQYGRYDSDN